MATVAEGRTWYRGEYDDAAYWERVDRNLAWLGETEEEARANQEKLRDATIGIAGVGGIGGAVAARLVRMGARHVKVADPDHFEMSNVQRQIGARVGTLGRNKAEVVAEMVNELTGDSIIDVFPEGITEESAEEFVEGCDVVCDQIEFYELAARFALHRAARKSERCKVILSVGTAGHGALVHKYTKDSMPVEEAWGLPEGATTKEEIASAFVDRLVPRSFFPAFPSRDAIMHWLLDKKVAPIWGAAPPLCEGVLVDQICNHVIGFPGMHELPPIPAFAWIDMFQWKATVINPEEA
ncbi:MAG: ThiF family adenylyltransferase [Gaiellaceae bacterium]